MFMVRAAVAKRTVICVIYNLPAEVAVATAFAAPQLVALTAVLFS
jgi:hypothetical protein